MKSVLKSLLFGLKDVQRDIKGRILDLKGPKGSFILVITNDPDHGRTDDYARVFGALSKIGLRVTTSVFCNVENDDSELARHCHRGDTHSLADSAYRDLMMELREQGHEIAFHGYSQVSNTRDKFIQGLETFKDIFGDYPFTYMEHGGNPLRHPPGMCKQESLALDGMNPESPYYVWDVIREKIGYVWAWHDLLDDDYGVKHAQDLFSHREGVTFFRRARLHYLDRMLNEVSRQGGVFLGYTHFGYNGYPKEPEFRFENWTGKNLQAALKGLEKILRRHQVTNLTLKELAERTLDRGRGVS